MGTVSLTNQKLRSIPKPDLDELAKKLERGGKGTAADVIMRLLNPKLPGIDTAAVDKFIKAKYAEKVRRRRETVISDEDLLAELQKVKGVDWGVEQGQLDSKIQREYVRKFARYDDLVRGVAGKLHDEITGYVVASWYNHWTTELIEDHISQHSNVVPTIKDIAGVDLFFRDALFDLKVTGLPKTWMPRAEEAIANPTELARWLYENQGQQRFGDNARLYVVLIDREDVSQSWRLKRETDIVYPQIDAFLDTATVDDSDVLPFSFRKRPYTATCKILLVTKQRSVEETA